MIAPSSSCATLADPRRFRPSAGRKSGLPLRVACRSACGFSREAIFSLSGLAWADHQVQLLRMCDLRQFEDVGGLLFDRSGSLLCAVLLYF